MNIKMTSVNALKEAEYNPRLHPQKAIERLTASIDRFGFTSPILVQKGTNIIIAGHARLKAAVEAGLKEVPVIELAFDDMTAKAYNVADNRLAELTEWDFPALKDLMAEIDTGAIDIIATGWSADELENIFDYEPPAASVEYAGVDSTHENFIIRCATEQEMRSLQKTFGTKGQKISYDDAWHVLEQLQ
jgi:hypothetical protein